MRSRAAHPLTLAALLLGVLSCATPARALEAKPLRQVLRVRAGATCLSTDSLAPLVEQWLQADTVRSDVTIVVDGSASDPRSARLRVVREGQTLSHRAFEPGPARCESLQAAVSLAIALALKASLLDELGEPLPDDPAARLQGWSLSAAGMATYALLPAPAPGLELGARLALAPAVVLRFGVLGVGAFGVAFEHSAASFDSILVAARADACARIQLTGSLRARACSGLLGGPLYARGRGVEGAQSSVVGWIAWANGLGLDLELGEHWSLGFDFSLALPLHRVRIGIDDSSGKSLASQALAVAGYAASLGPLYRF
ncbi:MAG TPA: hypothetical protein VHM19_18405 [Polyangiales bacterium]|nr:hypothetical protein [Polyangiales bacterium]